MTHRDFEGWDEYSRRLAAAKEAGSPDWARLPQSRDVMLAEGGKLYFTGIPLQERARLAARWQPKLHPMQRRQHARLLRATEKCRLTPSMTGAWASNVISIPSRA